MTAEPSGTNRTVVNKSNTVPSASSSAAGVKPLTQSSGSSRTAVIKSNTVLPISSCSSTVQFKTLIPDEEFFSKEEPLDPATKVMEAENERRAHELAIKQLRRSKVYIGKPTYSSFHEEHKEDVNRDEFKNMVQLGCAKAFKADKSISVVLPNDFKYKSPDPENGEDIHLGIEKMREMEHRLATKLEDEVRYVYHDRGWGRDGHWETPNMDKKYYEPFVQAGVYL